MIADQLSSALTEGAPKAQREHAKKLAKKRVKFGRMESIGGWDDDRVGRITVDGKEVGEMKAEMADDSRVQKRYRVGGYEITFWGDVDGVRLPSRSMSLPVRRKGQGKAVLKRAKEKVVWAVAEAMIKAGTDGFEAPPGREVDWGDLKIGQTFSKGPGEDTVTKVSDDQVKDSRGRTLHRSFVIAGSQKAWVAD